MNQADIFKMLHGTFAVDPDVRHHFSDGLYARQMRIPKGYAAGQHAHEYSHFSILAKGKVLMKSDDAETVFVAPACIEVPAHRMHTIVALEDCEWFCIHATSETDVDKLDEVLISKKED